MLEQMTGELILIVESINAKEDKADELLKVYLIKCRHSKDGSAGINNAFGIKHRLLFLKNY